MKLDGGPKLDAHQSILERFRRDEITREEAGVGARACGFQSLEEAERAYLLRASRDREEIERQVLCGKKTPEEAEEWLVKRNAVGSRKLLLPPFGSNPDSARFDPMKQAYWTLAMTAAWIIWRTPDAVLRHWNDYLFECKEWHPRQEILAGKRMPAGGRIREGWELRKCKLVSLHDVIHEASKSDPAKMELGPIEAANDLWAKFTSGKPEATGIQSNLVSSDRRRIVIAQHEWLDLSRQHLHEGAPESVATHGDSGPRYDDVRVPREQVCESWKEVVLSAPEKPRRGRPPAIDWTRVEGEVFRLMDYHGAFVPGDPEWDCQARLEAATAQFVSDEFGETAVKAESVIRKHVTTSLDNWRKAKAGN